MTNKEANQSHSSGISRNDTSSPKNQMVTEENIPEEREANIADDSNEMEEFKNLQA